jgi:hypothetical protein
MRCWTPISVGEQGSVRNREQRMEKNGESRIANGEWKKTANSEQRIANGGIRVGAGSQPALPRHGEAVGEDSKPGRCNRLEWSLRSGAAAWHCAGTVANRESLCACGNGVLLARWQASE